MNRPDGGPGPRLSLARRIVHPLRVCLFLAGFAGLLVFTEVYRTLVIDIPCWLFPFYRRRFYHRLWNGLIRFWGRTTFHLCRIATGLRTILEGEIPAGRHIIVSNHQSTIDIALLFEIFRDSHLKFVAKKELLRAIPNVSRALKRGGFGIVDFSRRSASLRSLIRFARELDEWDGSPLLFPEGQRTIDGEIGPFYKAGIQFLVRETRLPVLPLVIDGLFPARSLKSFFLHLPGCTARVRLLPVIPAAEASASLEELPDRLEEAMKRQLAAMRRGGGVEGPR